MFGGFAIPIFVKSPGQFGVHLRLFQYVCFLAFHFIHFYSVFQCVSFPLQRLFILPFFPVQSIKGATTNSLKFNLRSFVCMGSLIAAFVRCMCGKAREFARQEALVAMARDFGYFFQKRALAASDFLS